MIQEYLNYQELYEGSEDLFAVMKGPDHTFDFVNSAHIKALGFNATGMKVRDAQPTSVEVHSLLDDVYKSGKSIRHIEFPITLDSIRYFNFVYSPYRNEKGEIDGVMTIATDVTEQLKTRQALKRTHDRIEFQNKAFALTLKDAPMEEILNILIQMVETLTKSDSLASILLLDESGKHLLHGAAPNLPDEYNKNIHGVAIGPEVGSCGSAAFTSEVVVAEDIQTHPYWVNFKDLASKFNLRSCWSTPIISSQGEVLGTFALYHKDVYSPVETDQEIVWFASQTAAIIIERKKEIAKRLFAEERLNLALSSANIGFWDWNAQTGYTYLSDTLMFEWGINPKTFKNTLDECMVLIHEEDRERVWKEIEASTFQGLPYDIEYRVNNPSAGTIWINAKGRYFLDYKGQPQRLSGITINVTERKEAEERLKKALISRDEFLSIASHELRTPLTTLLLQTQMQLKFIEKGHPEAYSKKNVDNITYNTEKQMKRFSRLIDDMLDVSRIRSGQLSYSPENVNLYEITEDILERMKHNFGERNIHVQFEFDNKEIYGQWDRVRIEQVIMNFFTNAIRYGLGKPVKVSLKSLDDSVQFSVADQGLGISEEDKKKIFDRFERAANTTEVSGLGLGLFISQEIITAHKGSIFVESELGKGSTFSFSIPRVPGFTEKEIRKARAL
jgi:signal transduction histidine kinase